MEEQPQKELPPEENNRYFTPPPQEPPDELIPFLLFYLGRLRVRLLFYWRKLVPPASKERRGDIQVQLRDSSEPDFDYFVLVLLSSMIATFGLLTNSAATIIGAMLVAPLMSPILGLGLASIRADTKMFRDAVLALGQGAALAIFLSALITWTNDRLPFVTWQDLPQEIISRTHPTPIDLGIALAGGLAATFALVQPQLSAALPGVAIATALMPPLCVVGVGIALGDWRVAGGAFLLFVTNAVTIAAASIALFYGLGFGPPRSERGSGIPRSLQISIISTILLLAPLGYQSYVFVQDATLNRQINEVVRAEAAKYNAELSGLTWDEIDEVLFIDITVLVSDNLRYANSVTLQDAIAAQLQETVQLKINQVFAAKLDPAVPPTITPTLTLGPSPSPTRTPVPVTPTRTETLTPTASPTLTLTSTATSTPTPAAALVANTYGSGVNLRSFPDGPSIAFIPEGAPITILYGYQIVKGWVWIEVQDEFGRVGWIPLFYTATLTPTRTPISNATSTPPPVLDGQEMTQTGTATASPTP
jgi:uncharacterized hydrophobic protein (TIGR00271 family)